MKTWLDWASTILLFVFMAMATVALVAVLFFLAIAFADVAFSHDAPATIAQPQGWQYPYNCCGNFDCRPLSQTAVKEKPGGYEIQSNGEVLGYTDPRLRDSPDGEWHRCSTGGAEAGKTICLFVPPRSY